MRKNKLKLNRKILILLLPLGVLLFYLSAYVPGFIEKYYSNGLYKVLAQVLSLVTGVLPVSLAEFIVISLALCIIFYISLTLFRVFRQKSGKRHILFGVLSNALIFVSIVYFAFVILWGLNYNRQPFSEIAGFKIQPASVDVLSNMCKDIIIRANELRGKVAEDKDGYMTLINGHSDVFSRAYKGYEKAAALYPELGGKFGRPKAVILSEGMSYTGITGVYFPFTAEANVNTNDIDAMIPATTCHEMAHQRGFSREDEANYIAYLTCSIHPDIDFQYSGTLLALLHSMNSLYSYDNQKYNEISQYLGDGVKRDIVQLRAHWRKYEGPVDDVATKINNTYLKANRQKDGVHSYGRMVDLLIAEYRQKTQNNPS
ncbi:MAG: DUF3810 domain-containing protein [Clostridia bacterium]|nr:DUF3810 domain-containing protein [Clostridia bacterium]